MLGRLKHTDTPQHEGSCVSMHVSLERDPVCRASLESDVRNLEMTRSPLGQTGEDSATCHLHIHLIWFFILCDVDGHVLAQNKNC